MSDRPPTRVVVVPILVDGAGRVLLCRMAAGRGVFPGGWALPGGGVEAGERLEAALRREVREELGIEVASLRPLLFKDAVLDKTFADGSQRPLHMIFLVYGATAGSTEITLNEEFSEHRWVAPAELARLELNELTRATLAAAGYLAPDDAAQIRAAIDGFIDAYNRGEVEALLSLYGDDLVKLRHGAPPESKADTAARLRAFFAGNRGRLVVHNDELIVSGDLAFARGTLEITVTPRTGGEAQVLRRRFVELWRKEGGRWKVVRTMDAER